MKDTFQIELVMVFLNYYALLGGKVYLSQRKKKEGKAHVVRDLCQQNCCPNSYPDHGWITAALGQRVGDCSF